MKIRKRRISSLLSLLAFPSFITSLCITSLCITSLCIKSTAVIAQQASTIVLDNSTEITDAEIASTNTSNVLQIEQLDFNVDPIETYSTSEFDTSTTLSNSINIEQQGELNILDLLIDGSQASISITQAGSNNQISDGSGTAMILMGDSINLSIFQIGNNNTVTGGMVSTNTLGANTVSVTQTGDNNVASFSQR